MANLTNVILHTFNWSFKEIASKASEISKLGYKFVLVSPPTFSEGKQWWARYQPKDYRVLLSPLGNRKDFTEMLTTLANNGVDVLVDIVLNHMANENRSDRLDFPGTDMLLKYKLNPIFEENKLFGDLLYGSNRLLYGLLTKNRENLQAIEKKAKRIACF